MLSPLFDTISGETSFAPAWRGHPISERCSVSSSPVAAGVIICLLCLLAPALPFCVRTPWYSAASVAPPHHLIAVSLILLACHAHQSRSPSGRVSSAAAYRSHRLGCLSVRSPRVLIRPASSTRGAWRTAGRRLPACSVGLVPVGFACPFDCVGCGTGVISFCVLSLWIVWIACPPSCDCRAILLRLERVVSGFVSFAPIAPPRFTVPSHPSRSSACLVLIAPRPRSLSVGGSYCCFRPIACLSAHHTPPLVSSKRGGFSKRIEFDAFKIVPVERRLPAACLLTV